MSRHRSRLGRGLESLLSVSDALPDMPVESTPNSPAAFPTGTDGHLLQIPTAAISPNPHQPRRQFNEVGIAELAASIRATGLIQPVLLRKVAEGFQLIAGERRLRAAKLAGLDTVPAIVRDVDAHTQAQMALVENVQREDLNPIDRAMAYRTLMTQLGLTQVELAGRLGEDRSSVANYLRLLDLAEPVQRLIGDGSLSMGHAKLIAGIADILEQERLAKLVVAQSLSVRNLERLVQEGGSVSAPKSGKGAPSAHLLDLEKSLSRQLGMRVQIRAAGKNKGRGKLLLHYGSLDQFDDLVSRLGLKTE